jgi:hypothetical protein
MENRIETCSCFCGAIAAEMHGEPFWICYDHDDDCRRAIGSLVNVWVGYRTDQFRLTRGMPKSFSKTKGVVRTFCPECGTSISYLDEGLSNELYVTIGFLDRPAGFRPQAHAYWQMKCRGSHWPMTFRTLMAIPGNVIRPSVIPSTDEGYAPGFWHEHLISLRHGAEPRLGSRGMTRKLTLGQGSRSMVTALAR